MSTTCPVQQSALQLLKVYADPTVSDIAELTLPELEEIALYTIQKINNYPKSFGKTVENYFSLLFPDEVKGYLIRRAINKKFFDEINAASDFAGEECVLNGR